MDCSRRTFLRLGAAGGAGVAFATAAHMMPGGVEQADRMSEGNLHRDHPEEWVPSVCGECSSLCPLDLRRIGGNIVGVRPGREKPCARAYAIPQEIYHPDRIKTPLRRKGERGSGFWDIVSPEEIVGTLADILRRTGGKSAFVLRDDSAVSSLLAADVARAVGSSNIFTPEHPLRQEPMDGYRAVLGSPEWRYDLSNARGIVSFGWDWLQAYPASAEAQKAYARLRRRGLPMIHVGPRYDLTAMKSRRWLACRPGCSAAAAHAVIAELVRGKKLDTTAIAGAEGLEGFLREIAGFDTTAYLKMSGISRRGIEELTETIAADRPLCVTNRGRWEDQTAVVVLNALLGHVGREGGILPSPRPFGDAPTERDVEEVPRIALDRGEFETIVLVGVNPAFASPQPSRWREALGKARQVIAFSSWMDETARSADIVLPFPLPAEKKELYRTATATGWRTHSSAAAAGDGMLSPSDLFLSLIDRLGDEVRRKCPWKTLEEYAATLPSRIPPALAMRFPAPAVGGGYPLAEEEFHLLLDTPAALPRMEGGHLPYVLTTVGPHLRSWWTTWVEINPHAAARLGIRDRDMVVLENGAMSIRARAKIFSGVPADALCVPLGLGHAVGTHAQAEGGNPAEIVALIRDRHTGIPLWEGQRVKIRRENA